MQRYGLTYYVAVGDHDIGDDPWPPEKVKLFPPFQRAFSEHFGMPANGPAGSSAACTTCCTRTCCW